LGTAVHKRITRQGYCSPLAVIDGHPFPIKFDARVSLGHHDDAWPILGTPLAVRPVRELVITLAALARYALELTPTAMLVTPRRSLWDVEILDAGEPLAGLPRGGWSTTHEPGNVWR
jgi:hypothetical protein